MMGSVQPFEKEYLRKDGSRVPVLVGVASFEESKDHGVSFVLDLTDRKQAELGLRESEERFRTLVQFSFDVYWESDAQHRFIRQEFAEGLADPPAPDFEIGKTRWEVPCLEPDAEAWRKHRETLEAHLPFRDFELARPTPDGGKRYVSVSGLPVFDKAGRFIGYRGVSRHITERKRAEEALRASAEALRRSEERWRTVFQNAPVGIGTLNLDGRFDTANPTFQRMLGYGEDELRDLTGLDITHEDDRAATRRLIDEMMAGGRQSYQMEKRYRRKDGQVIWVLVNTSIIPASGSMPAFFAGVVVDMTERKRAQEELRQLEADLAHMNRVSMMGELAASLAHEITQPVGSAGNNARAALNFLDQRPPDLGEVREALGSVVGDSDRAGDIIDRIREHIKKAPPRKGRFDLNAAINEVIALAHSAIVKNGVSVETRLVDGLLPVQGDRVQLQQVVLNLILNAVEAMGSVEAGALELSIGTEQTKTGGALVAVRDSGPGIDPEHLERVFEAFYTTKSSGTGMGLSICRSIIDAHGGRLWAGANEPGGAAFQFTLPSAEVRS
jgi:PAS domain S-box-containing protein